MSHVSPKFLASLDGIQLWGSLKGGKTMLRTETSKIWCGSQWKNHKRSLFRIQRSCADKLHHQWRRFLDLSKFGKFRVGLGRWSWSKGPYIVIYLHNLYDRKRCPGTLVFSYLSTMMCPAVWPSSHKQSQRPSLIKFISKYIHIDYICNWYSYSNIYKYQVSSIDWFLMIFVYAPQRRNSTVLLPFILSLSDVLLG